MPRYRPVFFVVAFLAVAAAWPSTRVFAQSKKPLEPVVAGWQRPVKQEFAEALLGRLKAPSGFTVSVFAKDLGKPRTMVVLEDGTVLVARKDTHDVVALRDEDGDGRADRALTSAWGIGKVHGLALQGNRLYLAGEKELHVAEVGAGGLLTNRKKLADDLPDGGQHPYRTLGIGPDGMLYISIGSDCNDCDESNPEHATMLQYDPKIGQRTIYARGLRNTIGFDWHPKSGDLWGADIGTDWRGDDLPPDEINRIVSGGNYGWPYCFGARVVDDSRQPPSGVAIEKLCAESKPSDLDLPAHISPVAFVFARGSALPGPTGASAFAALHGSWNRRTVLAPKVVRIVYENGKPVRTEDFLTGFLLDDGRAWFGRPAALAVTRDGALLVADDEGGVIYRVARGNAAPDPPAASGRPAAFPILTQVAEVRGLSTPESALHDPEQDVYFVSNMNGIPSAKDGNGFISRIGPDGKIVALKFVEGGKNGATLHAPKGMAIVGDTLWVADIDAVRRFDRRTGAPIGVVDAAPLGAVFLNDLAVAGDGTLYVSDTGLKYDAQGNRSHPGPDRIFRVAGGKPSVVLEGEFLGGPNGLAWDADRNQLLIGQFVTGKDVLAWKPGDARPSTLVSGDGQFDGLVALPSGGLLVSSHRDATIHATEDAELHPRLASPPSPGDIGLDGKRRRLLVPSLDGDRLDIWQLP